MKLVIISHTNHYLDASGTIVGWGLTITELNNLAPHFETIYHVAMLHRDIEAPLSSIAYTSSTIHLVPLPPVGGSNFKDKMGVLFSIPRVLSVIHKTLKKVDVFQFRAPTGIGVFVLPYLIFLTSKKGWFKYAGNWKQANAPYAYAFQRWMLTHQSRKVTINGSWKGQPEQCVSFENPCLTHEERALGAVVIGEKSYKETFDFCFVGRLEDAKGVHLIVEAFTALQNNNAIGCLHLIGDGPKKDSYKKACSKLDMNVNFYGFLTRDEVFEVYKKCHFILLPSKSEGFPKVIAEGMNFGCIPIVSNVSSIAQYVKDSGFLIDPLNAITLQHTIEEAMLTGTEQLQEKANSGHTVTKTFTFEHYNARVLKELTV